MRCKESLHRDQVKIYTAGSETVRHSIAHVGLGGRWLPASAEVGYVSPRREMGIQPRDRQMEFFAEVTLVIEILGE